MLLLVATLCLLSFSSCSNEDKDEDPNEPELPTSTIINGIDLSLLPGHYEFGGNIAPSFTLYSDGSCETYSTGASTNNDTGRWTYDRESKILVLLMDGSSNHTYTVKSLSETSITAEWSSVKYGNFTSTWERVALPEIDASLIPGYYGYIDGDDPNTGARLQLGQDGKVSYGYISYSYIYNRYKYETYVQGTWTYDETRRILELKGSEKRQWRIISVTPTSLEIADRFGQSTSIYTRIE